MGKKKNTDKQQHPSPDRIPQGGGHMTSVANFVRGPEAKWLYFGIFLLITILLFQEFIFSNDMLFGSDTIPDGIYTRKYYQEYHAEYGGIPRWNPFIPHWPPMNLVYVSTREA